MSTTPPPELRPTVRRAATAFFAVAVILAVLAVAPHGLQTGPPWLIVLLAGATALAERRSVHLEFRNQAVASSATSAVVVVALVTLAPLGVLLVTVLGSAPSRLRGPWAKAAVNWGLSLTASAMAITLFHTLAGGPAPDTLIAWLAIAALTLAQGVLDVTVLSVVVRVATGQRDRIDAVRASLMVGWSLLWAAVGLAVVLVGAVHPVGVLLVLVPAVAAELLTQLAVQQHKELRRLRTLYDLSAGVTQTSGAETELVAVLREAREVLHCTEVELVLLASGPDSDDLVARASADGLRTGRSRQPDPAGLEQVPATWTDGPEGHAPVLTPGALVVPIASGGELLGSIRAWGRPNGRSAFGAADEAALRGLATQVGAVIGRRRLTAQLRAATDEQAYLEAHDLLTSLGNRRWFATEIEAMSARSGVTVVILNLRGFRRVNEALGQIAGDRLLVEVAERLRAVVPEAAAIARLGGDEFGFAVPGDVPVDVAGITGDDMTMRLRGREARLDLAVGWAHMPSGAGATQLLRRADLALTVARAARLGAVVGYEPALEDAVARRAELLTELPDALRDGTMDVHLQPQLDLATHTVVGAEALVRWTHPTLGAVGPDEFVPLVEELGLAPVLARHVLRLALTEAAMWHRAGRALEVSVNVSAHDLDGDDLVRDVEEALQASGMPASSLTLELTETAMMTDRVRAMATIASLAALGVRLSIDDFGTGHSSLAYLAELPVGEVKIDRAFISKLAAGADGEVIVRTVTELGGRRGFVVVAEGVEDAATLARLRELGVHRAQGWHIGRPVPRDEFAPSTSAA